MWNNSLKGFLEKVLDRVVEAEPALQSVQIKRKEKEFLWGNDVGEMYTHVHPHHIWLEGEECELKGKLIASRQKWM